MMRVVAQNGIEPVRDNPLIRLVRSPLLWFMVLAAAMPLLVTGRFMLGVLTLGLMYIILVSGFNFTVGMAGQISLGQIGFWAIGAYVSAITTTRLELPIILGILLGIVVAVVFAAVLTLITSGLKTHYLALATIGFAEVVRLVIVNYTSLTEGTKGIPGIPAFPDVFGSTIHSNYYITLAIVIVCLIVASRFTRTRLGRAALAMKVNERAAECTGISLVRIKVVVGVIAAGYGALAGSVYVHTVNFISPDTFNFGALITILAMLIIGGQGTLMGPVIGAVILTLLPEFLREFEEYWGFIYAVLLLALVLYVPRGVLGLIKNNKWYRHRSKGGAVHSGFSGSSSIGDDTPAGGGRQSKPTDSGMMLRTQGVTVEFGGVTALNDCAISASEGSVRGVIGPNGAGKTTFVNVCTGLVRPAKGEVFLGDVDLAPLSPSARCRLGLARTFQAATVFPEQSVFDNVLVGAENIELTGLYSSLLPSRGSQARSQQAYARTARILQMVGLQDRQWDMAEDLPYGQQRLVDLARALATDPKIVLLDEPAAGLNDEETDSLAELIDDLKSQGLGFLVIEHDMKFLMGVSDRVSALNFGQLLAEGTPESIVEDEKVVEAYLGVGE